MAHRTNNSQINHTLAEVELMTGRMTGNGANDLQFGAGDVLTGARQGTGDFILTFRHKYPQGLVPLPPAIVATAGTATVGLVGVWKTWDPAAGTARVQFSVGAAATDPAATDSIRFAFLVRNSGRNPSAY